MKKYLTRLLLFLTFTLAISCDEKDPVVDGEKPVFADGIKSDFDTDLFHTQTILPLLQKEMIREENLK